MPVRTIAAVTLSLSMLASPVRAGEAPDRRKPSDSPNYAGASAHAPHFDDRRIWPEWVKKTAFIRQKWPKARLLVWAHAGEGGRQRYSMSNPAHWRLPDGSPARRGPDKNTDIVFPAGRYHVAGKQSCHARHMTVEAGVSAFFKSITLHGNMWIKEGGSWHAIQVRGAHDTFMRNDNDEPALAANKIAFNKPPGRSIEWVGRWKLGDELDVFSGRFVVAPDSVFMPGDRSRLHVYPEATLVLLSGSAFRKRDNQYWAHDMEVEGTVLAGTPQRPLTGDCTLGLSFKAKGNAKGRGKNRFHNTREGEMGLILYKPGRIAVHSADPKTARLVIRWRGFGEKRPSKSDEPDEVAAMPHGIDMILLGKTDFDGVVFDNVLEGGILMPDPDARKDWKHVVFAERNFAPPAELFARYEGPVDIEMRDTGVAKHMAKQAEAGKKQEIEERDENLH